MKEWTLIGIPLVITALAALASVEQEDDTDRTHTMLVSTFFYYIGLNSCGMESFRRVLSFRHRPAAQLNEATEQRGTAFMQQLYKENLEPIFSTWGSHKPDFEWLEKMVIYGLFLSDHTVLCPIESELVVLSAIMCQGLKGPTTWHLRGLRRLGVSAEDVEEVQSAVVLAASWSGMDTKHWPRLKDVKENQDL